jgi:hypothetical protein
MNGPNGKKLNCPDNEPSAGTCAYTGQLNRLRLSLQGATRHRYLTAVQFPLPWPGIVPMVTDFASTLVMLTRCHAGLLVLLLLLVLLPWLS